MSDDGGEWLAVSDLMAGLMMVFLLIAVAFMFNWGQAYDERQEKAEGIPNGEVSSIHEGAHIDPPTEGDGGLPCDVDPNVVCPVPFSDPDRGIIRGKDTLKFVQLGETEHFRSQESEITDYLKHQLDTECPEFVKKIDADRNNIDEIRIEGHTSKNWKDEDTEKGKYLNNLELSQQRALNVLKYCFRDQLDDTHIDQQWYFEHLRAIGMSSAVPETRKDGTEDPEKSRRVEIRLIKDQ